MEVVEWKASFVFSLREEDSERLIATRSMTGMCERLRLVGGLLRRVDSSALSEERSSLFGVSKAVWGSVISEERDSRISARVDGRLDLRR